MQSGRQIEGVRYLLVTLVAVGILLPAAARAQPCQHGASIFKTCESVKRTCTNDADCDDGIQCTNDVCDQAIGNTTNCTIALQHADTCGDTTKITEGFDIDDFGGDNVRTPPVGNLPISGVFGNAVCCAGPTLPCFVGPAGSLFVVPAVTSGCGALPLPGAGAPGLVTFKSNTYVIQPDDPDPLPNQGNVKVQDLCNAGALGCSTGVNTVQFTASTDLVTGCTNTNKPGSTPCVDIDGNACTTAGCDGFGSCDQAHLDTPCPADTNPCTDDLVCNPQTGLCPHPPVPDSSPCPDADGNLCTTAGCENGQCVQTHITIVCPPDTNQCTNDPACNPSNGICEHPPVPDSTPCTDTDSNSCTGAGCEQGQCVQNHINNCPPPIDHVQCYEAKPAAFTVRNVTAQDQFGTLTLQIRFPHRLCAPANKNGEGILDPTEHLTGYKAKAPFTKSLNHTVTNQFGSLKLDVVRPDLFMVPTEKDGVALAPPPGDHFTCYKVRRSRGTPKFVPVSVSVADQLQTVTETLTKPIRLCAPANKNGENPGAQNHPDHLLCYKTKTQTQFGDIVKPISNQFGQTSLRLIHRRELCVPSLKDPSGTSTTSTTVATTSTTVATPTTVATTSTTSTTVIGSTSGAFLEERS